MTSATGRMSVSFRMRSLILRGNSSGSQSLRAPKGHGLSSTSFLSLNSHFRLANHSACFLSPLPCFFSPSHSAVHFLLSDWSLSQGRLCLHSTIPRRSFSARRHHRIHFQRWFLRRLHWKKSLAMIYRDRMAYHSMIQTLGLRFAYFSGVLVLFSWSIHMTCEVLLSGLVARIGR